MLLELQRLLAVPLLHALIQEHKPTCALTLYDGRIGVSKEPNPPAPTGDADDDDDDEEEELEEYDEYEHDEAPRRPTEEDDTPIDDWKEVVKKKSLRVRADENDPTVSGVSPPKSSALESPPPVFASSSVGIPKEGWGSSARYTVSGFGGPAGSAAFAGKVSLLTTAPFPIDDPYCRLWMGHIPRHMDEAKLKTAIGKLGVVKKIHVMESKVENGLLAAFVTMGTPSDAAKVITGLHMQKFADGDERELLVRLANPAKGVTPAVTTAPPAMAAAIATANIASNEGLISAAALKASISSATKSDVAAAANGTANGITNGVSSSGKPTSGSRAPWTSSELLPTSASAWAGSSSGGGGFESANAADDPAWAEAAALVRDEMALAAQEDAASLELAIRLQREELDKPSLHPALTMAEVAAGAAPPAPPLKVDDAMSWPSLGSPKLKPAKGNALPIKGLADLDASADPDAAVEATDTTYAAGATNGNVDENASVDYAEEATPPAATWPALGGAACQASTGTSFIQAAAPRGADDGRASKEDGEDGSLPGLDESCGEEAPTEVGVAEGDDLSKPSSTERGNGSSNWREDRAERDGIEHVGTSELDDAHATSAAASNEHLSRLWVGHLPPSITEAKLREVFGAYGTVTKVYMLQHAGHAQQKEFALVAAFVSMASAEEAKAALAGVHETNIDETNPDAKKRVIVRVSNAPRQTRLSNETDRSSVKGKFEAKAASVKPIVLKKYSSYETGADKEEAKSTPLPLRTGSSWADVADDTETDAHADSGEALTAGKPTVEGDGMERRACAMASMLQVSQPSASAATPAAAAAPPPPGSSTQLAMVDIRASATPFFPATLTQQAAAMAPPTAVAGVNTTLAIGCPPGLAMVGGRWVPASMATQPSGENLPAESELGAGGHGTGKAPPEPFDIEMEDEMPKPFEPPIEEDETEPTPTPYHEPVPNPPPPQKEAQYEPYQTLAPQSNAAVAEFEAAMAVAMAAAPAAAAAAGILSPPGIPHARATAHADPRATSARAHVTHAEASADAASSAAAIDRTLQQQLDEAFVKGWNACLQAIQSLNKERSPTQLQTLSQMRAALQEMHESIAHAGPSSGLSSSAPLPLVRPAAMAPPAPSARQVELLRAGGAPPGLAGASRSLGFGSNGTSRSATPNAMEGRGSSPPLSESIYAQMRASPELQQDAATIAQAAARAAVEAAEAAARAAKAAAKAQRELEAQKAAQMAAAQQLHYHHHPPTPPLVAEAAVVRAPPGNDPQPGVIELDGAAAEPEYSDDGEDAEGEDEGGLGLDESPASKGQNILRMITRTGGIEESKPPPMVSDSSLAAEALDHPSSVEASADLPSGYAEPSMPSRSSTDDEGAPPNAVGDEPGKHEPSPKEATATVTSDKTENKSDMKEVKTDGWSSVPSSRERRGERHPPSAEQMEAEITERLAFLGPLPGSFGKGAGRGDFKAPTRSRYWAKGTDGQRADDWLRAVPHLSHKESQPLPKLVELLTEAGAAGMELGQIARQLGTDVMRMDLLKLKAYLTCFPSCIVVAPKTKPPAYAEGVAKRVDQVWLIS